MAYATQGFSRAYRNRFSAKSLGERLLLGTAFVALLSAPAIANPTGGQVSTGSASISSSGGTTAVRQTSEGVVINWSSFNIGNGQTTRFYQPNSHAIAVNRIGSKNASQILGTLDANGNIVLINGNGILFGKGSRTDVGSLVATSTDGTDQDVLSGKFTKAGSQSASVVNRGVITVGAKGTVALVAPNVTNSGTVNAMLGTVTLGAANKFTVDLNGDGLVSFAAQGDVNGNASVVNKGRLVGANVSMTAHAAEGIATGVVNSSGVVVARGAHEVGGTIVLDAGDGGSIDISGGKLEAKGPKGGGTITVGSWNDASVTVNPGAILNASATKTGDGGHIKVVSNSTNFAGNALAQGGILSGNGGLIETSGHSLFFTGSRIDASATHGKAGTWLLDPDDLDIDSADATEISNTLGTSGSGTNVELQTTSSGCVSSFGTCVSGSGDINIGSAISWGSSATLTLDAWHSLNILAPITITGAGGLVLQYNDESTDGALNFGLTGTGFTGNITYGATNNGGTLEINGTTYTLVYSMNDIQGINATPPSLAGNYALADSIDATGVSGWLPIGESDEFYGVFNGLGNTISNLTINDSSDLYVGLFGVIGSGGTIANIGVVGGSISVSSPDVYIGGLAGWNAGGTIANAYATGSVTGSKAYSMVGGLVGNNYGSIADSYATGAVVAGGYSNYAGGLAGYDTSSITNSYATGSVSASGSAGSAGGLVGSVTGGSIANSYATGSATGTQYVGGLVAYMPSGSVTNVYATGAVSGGTNGGLIGDSAGTISSGYWDTTTSGTGTGVGNNLGSGNALPETTAQLANSAVLAVLNSGGTVWGNAGNQTTPYLLGNPGPVFLGTDSSATPTAYNPILSVQQLQNINNALSANFVLAQNIDASGYAFTPIGESTAYTGTFDGIGNTISNLTSITTFSDAGLFSQLGGTVENLGLTNVDIQTAAATSPEPGVGALAGFSYGTITNVYSTGTVAANLPVDYNTYAGGLVGFVDFGPISNSYSTATVSGSGSSSVGGLVGGDLFGGDISHSYATGSVTGGDGATVGGLVGLVYEPATIGNSYATGNVSEGDSGYAGGLIGQLLSGTISNSFATGNVSGGGNGEYGGFDGSSNGTITQSYATGTVSKSDAITGGDFGGFSGGQDESGVTTQSYSTGAVTADSTATIGGFIGSNGGHIEESYSSGIVTGGATNQAGGFAGSNGLTVGTPNNGYIGDTTEVYYNSTGNSSLPGVGTNYLGTTDIGAIADMTKAANFTAWTDFGATPGGTTGQVWVIVDQDGSLNNAASAAGGTTPMLLSEYSTTITSAHQLQLMELDLAATYTLANNINAAGTAGGDVWGAAGFIPIGRNTPNDFTGTFNGDGNTISDLTIDSTQTFVGLFGLTRTGATVENVGLIGGSVSGTTYVGDLVGVSEGTITDAYATGTVYSSAGVSGGLAGWNDLGTISDSYATGPVSGGTDVIVGGLVGVNRTGSSITDDYATGNVSGGGSTSEVGGLVGSNGGSITDSYATGSVNGINAVGGLVGYDGGTVSGSFATGAVSGGNDVGGLVGESEEGAISNSYAMGAVSGAGDDVGGLVGALFDPGSSVTDSFSTGQVTGASNVGGLVGLQSDSGGVTDSYWDTQTSGKSTDNAGATPEMTAGLQGSSLAGFSNATWGTGANLYPYLLWQIPSGTPQAVSGIVKNGASAVAGENVGLLVGGSAVTPALSMNSGANGYYYLLLAPGTISSGGSDVVTYLTNGTPANTYVQNATGTLSGVELLENTFIAAGSASDSNTLLAGLPTALASASGPQFLYTAGSGIVAGVNLAIVDSASSFTLDSSLDVGDATLSLATAGSDTQTSGTISVYQIDALSKGGLSLTQSGNIIAQLGTVANSGTGGISVTSAQDLTVAGSVSAGTGTITLDSTGTGTALTIDGHLLGGTIDLLSSGNIREGTGGIIHASTLEGSADGYAFFYGANKIAALGDFTTTGASAFALYDWAALDVTGTVNTGTHSITLVNEIGNLEIDGALSGGKISLKSVFGDVTGAGTIDASLLNVSADTGIDLDGANDIVAVGTDHTNSGSNVINQH